ncbi:hypothetical protein ACFVXH_39855 [Kitasatospora sp. NPDC058184]|uniref:hypothetical protein n=1 Tax=Kitasatospora sp. NPDC058184 TaxID=3346370 RepID=UPI0036DEDEF2
MEVPRRCRESGNGGRPVPTAAVVLTVAVLALFVLLAAMGLSADTIIALSSAAVLTAAELVRRLVSATSGRRRR